MFTFPRAQQNSRWAGQQALIGGLIRWFGGPGLGLCFGFSTLWVKLGAPFINCATALQTEQDDVSAAQQMLSKAMQGGDMLTSLSDTAEDIIEREPTRKTAYVDGVASHIILDILQSTGACHFVVSFCFAGSPAGDGAHAIAVSFDAGETGRLFDPNYGVGAYQSRTNLCNDLHALLASYVVPGGHVTASYLLKFDHIAAPDAQQIDSDDEFGAFQSGGVAKSAGSHGF